MGVARRRGAGYDGWGRGEMRGCDGVISWDGMFDYMDPCWCSSGEEWSDQIPIRRGMDSRAPNNVRDKELKHGGGGRAENNMLEWRGRCTAKRTIST